MSLKALQIAQDFQTMLGEIDGTGEYSYDLGGRIYLLKTEFDTRDTTQYPQIGITWAIENDLEQNLGPDETAEFMSVAVVGLLLPSSRDNAAVEISQLGEDIRTAITNNAFGAQVSLSIAAGEIDFVGVDIDGPGRDGPLARVIVQYSVPFTAFN